jgi:uncharacterized damage-inducible protein DinB
MERRRLLTGFAAAPAAFAQSTPIWRDAFAKAWRDGFVEHWRDTKEYTLAVLDAMPADGFDTKPNPAQRTFGDQLRHLAVANVVYFNAFGLIAVPDDTLTTDRNALDRYARETDKNAVRKFVAASFDYVSSVLEKITEKDLVRTNLTLSKGAAAHSGTDVCLRAYMHTAHHRGQAVVYLRVKGITPPAWKFEPTAG